MILVDKLKNNNFFKSYNTSEIAPFNILICASTLCLEDSEGTLLNG